MSPLLPPLCITICTTVRKFFHISLVVELLIYRKKCFLIQQNKNYSSICKSIIITSPIGFNISLTNVDARLKQCCINVVWTLCNIVSTLFQRRALTLYQRCATLKIRRRILFHFQRRINFISTLIHNVDPMLKCWLGPTMHLTVSSYHVTYPFQSESTLYSCLNVKELLAQNRRGI